MKSLLRGGLICLLLASGAEAIPAIKVSVYQGKSRPVYQGTTNADGTFVSAKLPPGRYVVQFSCKSEAFQGDQFLLILVAGKQTLISNAVPGEKFAGPGVAAEMEVNRQGEITGQIASARALEGAKVRMVNGKRYHWVGSELGSNLGGRWVSDQTVIAQQSNGFSRKAISDMQSRAGEGSLANAKHGLDYSGLSHGK